MKKKKLPIIIAKQLLTLFLAAVLLMAVSCKKTENEPTTDNQLEFVNEYDVSVDNLLMQLDSLDNSPLGSEYADAIDELRQELGGELELSFLRLAKVRYSSIDNNGDPIKLSGLIIYPPFKIWTKMPLISYNHGTVLEKKYAPSQFSSIYFGDYLNFAEVIFAQAIASIYGWAVILPDYQGMGEDVNENHPYCNSELLAVATADMVKAAKNTMIKKFGINWSGQTFLMGYSEGGFVTMSAARELEKRNEAFDGSVCMDGPYDLSGTMLSMMLADNPFPVPYFLPMLLVGYNTIYPTAYPYSEMLIEPYRTDIPKYTNGLYSTDKVSSIMPANRILKDVFTPAFLDTLTNTNSVAYNLLKSNNSYSNWTPKIPMLIWHCKNDDCVPFGNYVVAKSVLGTNPNVSFVEWPPITPVMDQTIHVSAIFRALKEGSTWIYHRTK